MRVVVALGGNALLKRGEPMTAENAAAQRALGRARRWPPSRTRTSWCSPTATDRRSGCWRCRPRRTREVEPYPLDVLGAQTEGMIGYVLEQELGNAMPADAPLATVLTMVEVDPADPAFADPTKFVGPDLRRSKQADALAAEKGWTVQAGRRQLATRRAVAGAAAHLRDPADPLAPRARRRS